MVAAPVLWRPPLFNAASFQSKAAQNGELAAASQKQTQMWVEKAPALVIVPGWLSESSQYYDMASYLSSKGFKTLIVPLKWYNWIPSLGGRSVRPILDRIDATIARALNTNEEQIQSEDGELQYSSSDFFKEFINPKNGAQPPLRKEIQVNPLDTCASKVILVAHSAGGWICRILLGSKVPYDGRTYAASQNVRALITLGTPHVCTDKLTKRNMDFVNENYPGAAEAKQGVHYVCVAGKFARGQAEFGGFWKDFTWQSYELCCGEGDYKLSGKSTKPIKKPAKGAAVKPISKPKKQAGTSKPKSKSKSKSKPTKKAAPKSEATKTTKAETAKTTKSVKTEKSKVTSAKKPASTSKVAKPSTEKKPSVPEKKPSAPAKPVKKAPPPTPRKNASRKAKATQPAAAISPKSKASAPAKKPIEKPSPAKRARRSSK